MTGIYARQSIDKKGSLSIEGQIALCKAECKSDAYTIFKDKGFSGKNTRRPAFERMMKAVQTKEIQRIIVYRLDRFSRSIADFGRLWDILQQHNVEFISVNERFDTSTPMGRAMLHIIMVFAQLERETISERIRDNYHERARHKEWVGGPAPYGFSIGRLKTENGKLSPTLVPNEQADIVRRIYYDYGLAESTLGSIAKKLTEEGIPCGKRPAWDSVSISRVLHSPLYVMATPEVREYLAAKGYPNLPPPEEFDGEHACQIIGKRDRAKSRHTQIEEQQIYLLNHHGIIPAGLWLQCQHKLEQNRQIKNSGKGKHTWLSGLLKCARCGYSVKVSVSGGHKYLSCAGRSNYQICTQSFGLSLDELERIVSTEIQKLFAGCRARPNGKAGSGLREELNFIDEKSTRLVKALAEGSQITVQYINAELQRLDRQRNALLQKNAPPQEETAFSGLNFERLDFESRKLVAARVLDKVLLDNDQAELVWKV